MMKTLRDIQYLKEVKALMRVDFNVPIKNGKVLDDFRIRAALPTIEYLRKKGATIILISHLESADHENPSLLPVARHIQSLGVSVIFVKDWGKARETTEAGSTKSRLGGEAGLESGEVFLLENVRFFEGEKNNDPKFAEEMASLGDIYVNEAFSVDHREHASIVGVPKLLPGYAGLQLEKEVFNLSKAFNPPRPFLFILGGAKFETKLPLLEKFMKIADKIFVGGALATDFYRQKGYEVGQSLVSKEKLDLSPFLKDEKLLLPPDIINQGNETKPAEGLSSEDKIMDAGPKTMEALKEAIDEAGFILWNGPLGMYEDGFQNPTLELAKMIGEATDNGAESIVGGGDTLAAIEKLGIKDKFSFMSTGGGAMLDFLAKGTLPGIEALLS